MGRIGNYNMCYIHLENNYNKEIICKYKKNPIDLVEFCLVV